MPTTHDARQPNTSSTHAGADVSTRYEQSDLVSLIHMIIGGDPMALDELISRRRPVLLRGNPVGIADWVEAKADTRTSRWAGGDEALTAARDLILDRFTRLPMDAGGGTDCRHYYRGFLNHLPPPPSPPPEAAQPPEGASAPRFGVGDCGHSLRFNNTVIRRLTGYLNRHWRLCLHEGWRRRNRLTVAHEFRTSIGSLCLWVPACIPPLDRSGWVARNFGPIDNHDEGAAGKVQERINAWLNHALRERERQLHQSLNNDPFGEANNAFSIEHGWSHHGLAATVAHEKAGSPERLRSSIAALAPAQIKQLVLRIFEDVVGGCYHPSAIAREFGLHKSTLTRFAASRWRPGDGSPTPDLWLNTAQVLAHQPQFAAALQEAGLDRLVRALSDEEPLDHH
ncbi:MAG: hypothetical protein AAGA29_06880 [Planctomycetota bacterium]